MNKERNIFKIIRNVLIIGTIIGGFICWINIPSETAIHYDITFSPDAYGNKIYLLIIFILPLFSLFPFVSEEEYHVESEENMNKLRKNARTNAIIQLIFAIILSLIVWIILLKSLLT